MPDVVQRAGHEPWLILADDLTGCLDTSAQFARPGRSVRAILDPRGPLEIDPRGAALGVDLETRAGKASEAAEIHASAWARAAEHTCWRTYKKMDSVLRGHWEVELEALREAAGGGLAVVCPAVPSAGRVTIRGVQRVHGQKAPGGHLLHRLYSPCHGSLDLVRNGPIAVECWLRRCREGGARYAVLDAESPDDLESVALALLACDPVPLTAGAAGLAAALATSEYPGEPPQITVTASFPLVATASRHSSTMAQIEALVRAGAAEAIPLSLPRAGSGFVDAISLGAVDRSSGSREQRHFIGCLSRIEQAKKAGRSPVLFSENGDREGGADRRFARLIGATAAAAVLEAGVDCLVLSGGDSAFGALQALRTTVVEIDGLALPNVPSLRTIDGLRPGLRVITKSGGFGETEALVRILKGYA